MHPRRTSKLARKTRREGALRPKRTSMAEEETAKEKESIAPSALAEGEEAAAKKSRDGVRHTRPRTPASKAAERPRRHEPREE